jgi:hypothetical protein
MLKIVKTANFVLYATCFLFLLTFLLLLYNGVHIEIEKLDVGTN